MDPRVLSHAEIIVRYSTRVKKGETVGIYGNTLSADLVEAVYRETIKVGAFPVIRLSIPSTTPFFYQNANKAQLSRVSKTEWTEAKEQDVRVIILADSNTRQLSSVDPKKMSVAAKSRMKLKDYLVDHTRWCLTLHPTQGLAQEAGMSLEDYQDFVYSAMFCDKKDPIAQWQKIEKLQSRMIHNLKGAKDVRIVGQETDLSFSIKGRVFINSPATHNLPSGEIFTAPVEDSANGYIYYEIGSNRGGVLVSGIRLEFKNGKVVNATAEHGQDYLRKMIDMDPGASRLGELGIGTNFGIQKPTGEILFDEKIGGTVHLALGASYKECGGKNVSALHWDMIKDLRKGSGGQGGYIEIDGIKLKVPRK
ncbi:MAG: aminopeptidase [Candidatus Lindowbacteria bacterium]|nr:aminopeptidase [Candidatus Lindowbacteria bacterium]